MAEDQRRSTRARHPPRLYNLDGTHRSVEEEEGENYMSLTNPIKKETKQTLPPMNTMAKLLNKFISQANSHYRQYRKNTKKQKNDKERKLNHQNARQMSRNDSEIEQPRKNNSLPKKAQDSKLLDRPREFYTFNTSRSVLPEPNKNGPIPYSMNSHGTNPVNLGLLSGVQNLPLLASQLNQLQESYPGIKQYMSAYQNNPTALASAMPSIIQQQMMFNSMLQNKPGTQQTPVSTQNASQNTNPAIFLRNAPRQISDSKLFKRSSYHVAIAYHIHLRKIQNNANNEPTNIANLDPTYHARKLRDEKCRQVQGGDIHGSNPPQ